MPGLVMSGALDEQDNVPVAKSVKRLAPIQAGKDLTVRVFDGTGHALFDEGAGDRSLRADAVNLLIRWIHERSR